MPWALARAGHEEPRAQAARHGYSFADPGRSARACGCTVGILLAMKACAAGTAALLCDMMYAAAFRAPFRLDIAGGIL
jgi:hypothetical protein